MVFSLHLEGGEELFRVVYALGLFVFPHSNNKEERKEPWKMSLQ
jgi:hypothetical protein